MFVFRCGKQLLHTASCFNSAAKSEIIVLLFFADPYVFFCRAIALPLSTKLGVKDKQRPKAQPNPVLETFYSTRRKNPEEVSPFFLCFPVDLVSSPRKCHLESWSSAMTFTLEAQQRTHCSTGYLRAAGQESPPAIPSAPSSASEHLGGNRAPKRKRDSPCSLLTLHTAQTATQGALPEHQRPFPVRWGCPVRLWNLYPWENSKLSGHGPWHLALGGSIWAGPIGWGDLHSPFHPQPFCDSFFSYTGKPCKKISHISCLELPYC